MELIPDFGKYNFTIWVSYGASVAFLLAMTVHTLIENSKRKK